MNECCEGVKKDGLLSLTAMVDGILDDCQKTAIEIENRLFVPAGTGGNDIKVAPRKDVECAETMLRIARDKALKLRDTLYTIASKI